MRTTTSQISTTLPINTFSMFMSKSKNKGNLFWVALVLLVLGILFLLFFRGSSFEQVPQQSSVALNAPSARFTIDDIESIYIHSGLDIQCPALQGVSQHGYIYTVQLTNNRGIIERVGCGVGTPDIYAAAIAQDLDANGIFLPLNVNQMLDRMTFKLYEAR